MQSGWLTSMSFSTRYFCETLIPVKRGTGLSNKVSKEAGRLKITGYGHSKGFIRLEKTSTAEVSKVMRLETKTTLFSSRIEKNRKRKSSRGIADMTNAV